MRVFPLSNGLTVILAPFSHPAVAAVFACRAGYRFDPPHLPGLSHTVEHVKYRLAIKSFGRRRPRRCDKFTGQTDASSMTFALRTVRGRAPWMVSLLADGLVYSSRQRKVVRTQLENIREEAAEHESDIEHQLEQDFLRHFGVAWSDRPERFTPHDVERLMRRMFVGGNCVLVVAGGFDINRVSRVVQQRFGALPKGPPLAITAPTTIDHFRQTLTLRRDDGRKVSFVVGFPTFGFSHPDRFALGVLRNHLSSRDTSRFTDTLDAEAYGYSSTDNLWLFEDIGYLRFDFSMFPEKVLPALKIIGRELTSVRNELIGREDFIDAVENLRTGARIKFFDPLRTAVFYARQWINLGSVLPLRQYEQELGRVTRQRVRSVAQNVLDPRRLIFIARGPVKRFRKNDISRVLSLH